MSSKSSQCTDLECCFEGSGVARFAVAKACPVDEEERLRFASWIKEGCHGEMGYLERHLSLRADPSSVLEGVRSVVSCAVPYPSPFGLPPGRSAIAAYALGDDYHEVVRDILSDVALRIREKFGGATRVCVDTAPLPERYWAVRSGLGFTGLNGHLIIPGLGSFFFLGEILSTARLPITEKTEDTRRECRRCLRCVKSCPAGALRGDGSVDARRCLSYLTIEYRGEFPPHTDLHGHLYGCDVCGAVCPYNREAPFQPVSPRLLPREAVLRLSVEEAAEMDQKRFSAMFCCSAVKRTKVAGLNRNARALLGSLRSDDAPGDGGVCGKDGGK